MAGTGAMAGTAVMAGPMTRRLNRAAVPTQIKPARTGLPGITTDRGAMLDTKLISWALGLFAAISFVVCVFFGLVTPRSLHMHEFLEQVLPAFVWLTWWGFLLGLVESFLYGVYAGLVFCPIYNWLYRRFGADFC